MRELGKPLGTSCPSAPRTGGKGKDRRKFFWHCSALALFHAAAHRGPAPVPNTPRSTPQAQLEAKMGHPRGVSCIRVSQNWVSRLGCAKTPWPKSFAPGAVRERPVSSWELVGPAQPRSPPRGPKQTTKCPKSGGPPPKVAPGIFPGAAPSSLKQTWDSQEPKLPRPELGSLCQQQGQGLCYRGLILPCPCPAPLAGLLLLAQPLCWAPFLRLAPQNPLAQPGTPKCPRDPKIPARPAASGHQAAAPQGFDALGEN